MAGPVEGSEIPPPFKPKGGGGKSGRLGGRSVSLGQPNNAIKRVQLARFGDSLGKKQTRGPVELTDEDLALASRLYHDDMPRDAYQHILDMVIQHKRPFVEIAELAVKEMSGQACLFLYDKIAQSKNKWPYIKEFAKESDSLEDRWHLIEGILETDAKLLEAARELLNEDCAASLRYGLLFAINHNLKPSAETLRAASKLMVGTADFAKRIEILDSLIKLPNTKNL